MTKTLQEATEKLNILAVLEEEKNFLERIISSQNKKKETTSAIRQRDIGSDLDKLKEISNHQKDQIEVRELRIFEIKKINFRVFLDVAARDSCFELKIKILYGRSKGNGFFRLQHSAIVR